MTSLSVPGHPFQYAWVVPNLEHGVEYWSRTVGVGPFFVNEVDSSTMTAFRYRGGPGELRMRVAWAQGPEGQIELIEVLSGGPNVYRDLVPAGASAMHHVGIWTDDYERDVEFIRARGFELGMELETPAKVCYVDTSAATGTMLEIIERGPGIVGLFDLIGKAAQSWDGERPIRAVAELFT